MYFGCSSFFDDIKRLMDTEIVEAVIADPRQQTGEKWGDIVHGGSYNGFTIIPEQLLRNQGELEITNTEMVVLINLVSYWWFADRKPFPSDQKIADRIGSNARSVQRAMRGLEKKGLITREPTKYRLSTGEYLSRRLVDFSGLKRELKKLAA